MLTEEQKSKQKSNNNMGSDSKEEVNTYKTRTWRCGGGEEKMN